MHASNSPPSATPSNLLGAKWQQIPLSYKLDPDYIGETVMEN